MSSLTIIIILLCVACAAIFGLLMVVVVISIRNGAQVHKLTYPVYDFVIKKAEHEAREILTKAKAEAESLTQHAQKEGKEIITAYTKKAEEARVAFTESLDTFGESLEKVLSDAQRTGDTQLQELFNHTKAVLEEQEKSWHERSDKIVANISGVAQNLEKRAGDTLDHIDAHLLRVKEDLEMALKDRVISQDEVVAKHLKGLLAASESEIEAYKKARIEILDTRIEKLVEDVVSQVLHKELGGKDHAELARKALVEAKEHNLL